MVKLHLCPATHSCDRADAPRECPEADQQRPFEAMSFHSGCLTQWGLPASTPAASDPTSAARCVETDDKHSPNDSHPRVLQ
jgi:hypothetical protein